jgi:hypothetical protein
VKKIYIFQRAYYKMKVTAVDNTRCDYGDGSFSSTAAIIVVAYSTVGMRVMRACTAQRVRGFNTQRVSPMSK